MEIDSRRTTYTKKYPGSVNVLLPSSFARMPDLCHRRTTSPLASRFIDCQQPSGKFSFQVLRGAYDSIRLLGIDNHFFLFFVSTDSIRLYCTSTGGDTGGASRSSSFRSTQSLQLQHQPQPQQQQQQLQGPRSLQTVLELELVWNRQRGGKGSLRVGEVIDALAGKDSQVGRRMMVGCGL